MGPGEHFLKNLDVEGKVEKYATPIPDEVRGDFCLYFKMR